MTLKQSIFIYFCLCLIGCERWNFDRTQFTKIITVGAIVVSASDAFLLGDLENLRDNKVIETGFVFSSNLSDETLLKVGRPDAQTILTTQQDTITTDRAFGVEVSGLASSTTYFFRAFARVEGVEELLYGIVDTFQTIQISADLLEIACISNRLVRISSEISGLDAIEGIQEVGYVWSNTNELPILEQDNKIVTELVDGRFTAEISTVENQLYYVRAYFILDGLDPSYSAEVVPFSTTIGGTWKQHTNFPGEGRIWHVSFTIGNKGYFGFGAPSAITAFEECGGTKGDFWEFDPSTGWREIPKGGRGIANRSVMVGFSLDGKGYLGLGCQGNAFNDFHQFNPQNNTWQKLANTPSALVENAPLASRETAPIAFTIADKAYVGKKAFYQFDPTGIEVWSTQSAWELDQLQTDRRRRPVTFSIGNRGYLGFPNEINNIGIEKDFLEFDPDIGWTKIAPFPDIQRGSATALVIRDKAYIGLGEVGALARVLNDFWEFDPKSMNNPWRKLADFPGDARYGAIGFSINGRGYVGLGVDNFRNFKNDLWEYIPELCP